MNIIWASLQNLPMVLGLCILIALGLIYRYRRSRYTVSLLTEPRWLSRLVPHFSPAKLIIRLCLLLVGFAFLTLTLLHPQWNKKEEVVQQKGRDLLIALDISRSMLAKDCSPNRLECAKAKIKELIKHLSCERIGLLLFSGSAFIQCPLTMDYAAFSLFLDSVDVETIASGSTAFDKAITVALNAYASQQERKTKLLVMFTDGEDFSANLGQIKQQLKKEGVHLFTIGVGTVEGAPIPLYDNHGSQIGHMKDQKGSVVISRLNEQLLTTLAQDAGGTYIGMTPDERDVKSLASRIARYEKEAIEDKKIARYEEQYPYFLIVTFICLALEWLL